LVTGAAGFIGSHLVERLLKAGYRVVGLDNFDDAYPTSIKRDNIRTLRRMGDFLLKEGDIRDATWLAHIFPENNISTVVHLAARAGVRPSVEQPLLYEDVNIGGTINLLEASRSSGVRKFIFASSSSVYGLNGKTPSSEETKVDCPVSPYAASKAAGELFCRTYNHLYHLPVLALRLFTVYGPRQRPEMAIHHFVKMVDEGKEISLFGDGTSTRDYTYIDDIIDGFEAALAWQDSSFEIFNLGGGRAVSLGHVIRIIEETMQKEARVRNLAMQPGDVPITLADISKARTLLGYRPKTSIEEGIPIFVRWYLNNKGRIG
jgi:UDP-glucuronate 4-epimerase